MRAAAVRIVNRPGSSRAFTSLIARLPGVESIARGQTAGVWPRLRIPVDDEVSLEVIEAPAAARFAPAWRRR